MEQDPGAPSGAWFNPVAEFLGPAYLHNAFATRSGPRDSTHDDRGALSPYLAAATLPH